MITAANYVRGAVSTEDPLAAQHLVQHHAEGPNVGALVHRLAARLLRTHIGGRAQDHTHRSGRVERQGWRVLRALAGFGGAGHLGQSEIQHLHGAVQPQFDVAWLQIPVNDPLLVGGFERVGDLLGGLQRLIQRKRALLDPFCQRRPFHQFHHQVIGSDVVDVANVGMIQRRHRVYLAGEAGAEALGGNLDGHVPPHPRIVGAIHFAHAPGADWSDDLIGPEFCAGGERHAQDSAKFSRSRSTIENGSRASGSKCGKRAGR